MRELRHGPKPQTSAGTETPVEKRGRNQQTGAGVVGGCLPTGRAKEARGGGAAPEEEKKKKTKLR